MSLPVTQFHDESLHVTQFPRLDAGNGLCAAMAVKSKEAVRNARMETALASQARARALLAQADEEMRLACEETQSEVRYADSIATLIHKHLDAIYSRIVYAMSEFPIAAKRVGLPGFGTTSCANATTV